MAGIKGRSGPPGNRNAVGNPGGTGAPVDNSNAGRHGGRALIDQRPRVPAWLPDRHPAIAADIAARIEQHRDAMLAGGRSDLTPVQSDLLQLYGWGQWLVAVCRAEIEQRGPLDESGEPRSIVQHLLPRGLKQVADVLPLLKAEAAAADDPWTNFFSLPLLPADILAPASDTPLNAIGSDYSDAVHSGTAEPPNATAASSGPPAQSGGFYSVNPESLTDGTSDR